MTCSWVPPASTTVWVQRPSLQFGPGVSGATDLNALFSQTRVARPPEAGPQGPMRLAAAHCPWYLCLLDSALAALRESSLTLTSWRMRTSESEPRTPAFTPVGHDVTLAGESEREKERGREREREIQKQIGIDGTMGRSAYPCYIGSCLRLGDLGPWFAPQT